MLGGFLLGQELIAGVLNSNSISSIDKKIAEGSALRQQGKFVLAKTAFEEALELAKEGKDLNGQASCLLNIGALSWNLGQIKESVGYYEEALGICRELGLRDKEKICLLAIQIYKLYSRGKELRDQRRIEDSVRYFKEAVALAKKINSLEHELKCLRQMSLNYPQDHSEFYRLNNQALNIARKINHRLEEGRCLNNIGLYYWKSTKFSEALALLNEALAIIRENHRGGRDESDCLNNLGLVYKDLGDFNSAKRYYEQALKIDLSINDQSIISSDLNNLAELIRVRDGDDESKENTVIYLQKSVELARKSGNYYVEICALNNMGVLYQQKKDFAKSIEFLEAALQICQKNGVVDEFCYIFANLGNAHIELNNIEKAKQYFDKSLDLALSAGRNDVLWEVYLGLGRCMEKKNQPDLALTYYRLAVDVIDSIRGNLALDFHKAGFFRDKLKIYESCLNLLFRMVTEKPSHQFDEAFFHIVEKAKARTLIEELIENASNEKPASSLMQEKLAEISREISLTLSELTKANLPQKARQKIWEKLAVKEEEYAVLLNRAKLERKDKASSSFDIISLRAAREDVLDEETALVEFFLGETQSYAFLITRKDFFLKNLPGRAAIEDSLRAYLKIISSPPDKELNFIRAAQRICQELIFPLEKYCSPSIKHLIIIPDGVLYYLPFETLIPGQNEKNRESKYLIEYYNISYAPSVSSLAFLIKKGTIDRHSKLVLALGNPAYALRKANDKNKDFNKHEEVLREFYLNLGFDFSSLPFSKKEVKQVSRFFPKDKIDIYTGKEAKEEILKTRRLTDYQILHFACHAFLDEKTPYRSALVLAFDDDLEEDGFLQGWEIQKLKLNASLAILSACQTGKGKLENGEGVFGLQRVFFYAGARSTISTLWKVADKATSIFMYHFYYFLARGKNKAEALRLAKIKMLQSKFSHPFFWAGFILHGDHQHRLILD